MGRVLCQNIPYREMRRNWGYQATRTEREQELAQKKEMKRMLREKQQTIDESQREENEKDREAILAFAEKVKERRK